MRIPWPTQFPLFLALVVAGCGPTQQREAEPAPGRSLMQATADYDALRQQFMTLGNEQDAQGIAGLFTQDGVIIDFMGNVYQGTAAIAAYFTDTLAGASGLTAETTDVWMHGDVVAGYGTFSQTVQGAEGDTPMSGMWQNVCVYEPDGSLKIQMQMVMVPAQAPPAVP